MVPVPAPVLVELAGVFVSGVTTGKAIRDAVKG